MPVCQSTKNPLHPGPVRRPGDWAGFDRAVHHWLELQRRIGGFLDPVWSMLGLVADAAGLAVLILIAKGKIGLAEVHTSERYRLLFVLTFSLVVLLVVSLILLGLR